MIAAVSRPAAASPASTVITQPARPAVTPTFPDRAKAPAPSASAQTNPAQQNPLIIMIDRKGRYYVGSNQVLGEGEDALKQAIAAAAGNDHDRPVSLRADAMSTHQSVVTAMDALGQLGFTRMSIATTRTESGQSQ